MNAANGVGRILSRASVEANRILLRGGNGGNGDHAGVFTLNSAWIPVWWDRSVGFRCAFR